MGTGIIVGLVLVAFGVYLISVYNGLVSLKNEFMNAFSQIDVQLQRRYDLIPNLVETSKEYLKHESETLSQVIEARNTARDCAKQAAKNPDNADLVGSLAQAESNLGRAMGQFNMVVENYPELKADASMASLFDELVSTDNRVGYARQAYSDAVMLYNTEREQFPSNIIAGMFTFKPADLFKVRDTEIKTPIRVSFA